MLEWSSRQVAENVFNRAHAYVTGKSSDTEIMTMAEALMFRVSTEPDIVARSRTSAIPEAALDESLGIEARYVPKDIWILEVLGKDPYEGIDLSEKEGRNRKKAMRSALFMLLRLLRDFDESESAFVRFNKTLLPHVAKALTGSGPKEVITIRQDLLEEVFEMLVRK